MRRGCVRQRQGQPWSMSSGHSRGQPYARILPHNSHRVTARHCGTEKPTTYPALKELILVGAAHLLTLITTPSLVGVRLDTTSVPRANSWNDLPAFEDMVVRSSGCPNLRVLTLTNVQQSVPNFVRCLRRLPSLTSLSITDNEGLE